MTKAGPTKLAGDLPQMVVFDLDYTLWDAWCDTHVTPPLLRKNDDLNKVYDRHGQPLSFYRDVPEVLLNLHHSEVHVAAASRTHAPKVARQILSELLLPGSLRDKTPPPPRRGDLLKARSGGGKDTVSAIQLFDSMEIYPGSKLSHFRELNKQTGIPFEQMVFFDDEARNREVAKLGVTFVLVGPEGVTRKLFESGLDTWRKNRDGL